MMCAPIAANLNPRGPAHMARETGRRAGTLTASDRTRLTQPNGFIVMVGPRRTCARRWAGTQADPLSENTLAMRAMAAVPKSSRRGAPANAPVKQRALP